MRNITTTISEENYSWIKERNRRIDMKNKENKCLLSPKIKLSKLLADSIEKDRAQNLNLAHTFTAFHPEHLWNLIKNAAIDNHKISISNTKIDPHSKALVVEIEVFEIEKEEENAMS